MLVGEKLGQNSMTKQVQAHGRGIWALLRQWRWRERARSQRESVRDGM
jgi:hypothetical protein